MQTNDHVEGRIYLIVLDDLHTDVTRSPRVKAAATRFIESNFGTNDLAAVVFTGRAGDGQDFTNNPRLLVDRDQQVQRTQAAVGHARSDRGCPRRSGERNARAGRRHRADGSRVPRALDGELGPQARRVHGRRARAPQVDAADRRRRRLRHLRSRRAARIDGVVGAARHARRDRGRDPRQRQHLRDRSAGADERRGRPHRGRGARRRRRRPVDCRTSCGCRRTACACWPTARADSRP